MDSLALSQRIVARSALPQGTFGAMLALAAFIHLAGFVVWGLVPRVIEAPLPRRALLLRLGDDDAALTLMPPQAPSQMQAIEKAPSPKPVQAEPDGQAKAKKEQRRGTRLGNSAAVQAEIMARYEQLLSAWIEKHKEYPPQAREAGIQGEAVIRLRITRKGRLRYVGIDRSSGAPALDEAALLMAKSANPVPAVPKGYPGGDLLEFLIPVRFYLQ